MDPEHHADASLAGADALGRRAAMRSARRFGIVAAALAFALVGGFALLTRLEIFGAGFHLNFALLLGVAGTVLLGVGLMALSFYSDRSGADDAVLGMEDGPGGSDGAPL